MPIGDTLQPSYPNNSHEKDWAFYPFVAGGGSTGSSATGVTRYSFWINFDPFDVKNLKMLSENVSFRIFSDSFLTTPAIPYFIVDQSNDITNEIVAANLPTTAGGSNSFYTANIISPLNSYLDAASTPASGIPPTSSAVVIPTNINVSGTNQASNLVTGQTYYYVITSVVSGVESLPSTVVTFTPSLIFPSVSITWNTVPGASYYKVYRNTSNLFTSGNLLIGANIYGGQPPYYLNTTFTNQPASTAYQNDQGNYTLQGDTGLGVGFGGVNMLTQGFVPQQPQLTGIFLGGLFNSLGTDHTKYISVNVELWDTNKAFVQHLGTIKPTLSNLSQLQLDTDNVCSGYCNSISYNFGDDGKLYWATLDNPSLKFNTPVSLTVGSTYYLVVRLATLNTTDTYFIDTNVNSSNIRDRYYYYPFASSYIAVDGSSTWNKLVDNNSNDITFPFITQGNIGRYAITYWWNNLGGVNTYWPATPSGNEYVFLHVDYNQKI